jgi:hypothetical protein
MATKKRSGLEKAFIIAIVIMLFSLSLFLVSGVSVSPGNVRLEYTPNGVYEGVMTWGTGDRTDSLNISAYSNDGLKVTTDKKFIFCGEGQCTVKYKVVMPNSYDTPGEKIGYIVGTEYFENPQGASINVLVAMNFAIYVRVPYPGKYLEFRSFEGKNAPAGEKINFTAIYVSRGNETISQVSGIVTVYDRQNQTLGRVTTNTQKNVKLNDQVTLLASWDSGDYKQGYYHADILVTYDENKTNATTQFMLGGLDVDLINYTNEIIPNGIVPFSLLVQSIWSEDFTNMHARVAVLNSTSNQEITSFDTLTKTLPAWGKILLDGYMDSEKLVIGKNYNLQMTLFFADQAKNYNGTLSVIKEPAKPKEKGSGIFSKLGALFTTKTLMALLIILLIAAVAFLIFILLPKKKKEKKE